MQETFDEPQDREALNEAGRLTEEQLKLAVAIATKVLRSDIRQTEAATLAGIIQALAINYATVVAKK